MNNIILYFSSRIINLRFLIYFTGFFKIKKRPNFYFYSFLKINFISIFFNLYLNFKLNRNRLIPSIGHIYLLLFYKYLFKLNQTFFYRPIILYLYHHFSFVKLIYDSLSISSPDVESVFDSSNV